MINKDTNSQKIEPLKKSRAKQLMTIDKFERIEDQIHVCKEKVDRIEGQYYDWEQKLFKHQLEETGEVQNKVT